MRTLRSSKDIGKEGIIEILNKTKEAENGNHPDLKGKILGILTTRASLRTTASMKHSILKCGGDYIDLDARYMNAGEENLHDTVQSIQNLVDILSIRTTMGLEIKDLKADVPVINLMAGDEHTSATLWILYSMWKRWGYSLENKTIGVYGMVKFSQPMISFYRVWSKLGFKFIEDPVADELGADEKLINEIKENGGSFEKGKLEEFIDKVDFLVVTEGRFGEGAGKETLQRYDQDYRSITPELLSKLKDGGYWCYIAPRVLDSGKITVPEELDSHERIISEGTMMGESVYGNMALFEWLLNK